MNSLQLHTGVQVSRDRVVRRRDFLKGISLAGAAGTLGWKNLVAAKADELRSRGMACILLFMKGGPSQFETFSPKPEHENGGETKAIDTSVPGIQIAQGMPHMARMMQDVAIIRSMTAKEGNHARAEFLMHTGYAPTPTVKHPTLGSIVAHQLGDVNFDLPSFVRIASRSTDGGGLLGVEYDPFSMANAEAPANTRLPTEPTRFDRRMHLLSQLESNYARAGAEREVANHQKLYGKAAKMVTSAQMQAFQLDREPEHVRERYGKGDFAAACLLARRLVESGVTFVEVGSTGWDTHDNVFERTTNLCGQVDQPMAALVADLKERGLLDKTLVIWMGEFGRTPKINPRGGRDHFPRASNVALAGGGIRGGQVIGHTDAGGDTVTDHPVSVQDLFQSICKCLGINPAIENMSAIGRPIKIVDGGQPVSQLFG
jgi:hypothetical protein